MLFRPHLDHSNPYYIILFKEKILYSEHLRLNKLNLCMT